MACSVFGNPVTDDTVRLIYPDVIKVTAKHRADVALLYMNADDKAESVSKYVHNLKAAYGTGTSTLCTIYNATGNNLRFAMKHSFHGYVWGSPYPQLIQNGQWAGFLHVRASLAFPSSEAVAYSGKNNDGEGCEWMLAWNTPRLNYQNHVYTDIREEGYCKKNYLGYLGGKMRNQSTDNHSDTRNGCHSTIAVGAGSSPQLVAVMTLDNQKTGEFYYTLCQNYMGLTP